MVCVVPACLAGCCYLNIVIKIKLPSKCLVGNGRLSPCCFYLYRYLSCNCNPGTVSSGAEGRCVLAAALDKFYTVIYQVDFY